MKKTIMYLGIMFLATIAMTSCGNQDYKKEMEALRNENDSLKLLLNGSSLEAKTYLNEFSEKVKKEMSDKIFSGPITRENAQSFTYGFRNATTLNIPLAWEFEKSHIKGLIDNSNISGVRFYAGVNDSTKKFTIIAVSIDAAGNDIIGAAGDSNSLMFEFAAPCPSKCPSENGVLMIHDEDKVLQEFSRTAASVQSRIDHPHPIK